MRYIQFKPYRLIHMYIDMPSRVHFVFGAISTILDLHNIFRTKQYN